MGNSKGTSNPPAAPAAPRPDPAFEMWNVIYERNRDNLRRSIEAAQPGFSGNEAKPNIKAEAQTANTGSTRTTGSSQSASGSSPRSILTDKTSERDEDYLGN